MLSGGKAMLDMGESLRIDELVRTMQYNDDSLDKEQLKDATCHVKQIVGPAHSMAVAEVFLGTVGLCQAMPNHAQVHAIQHFLCEVTGCLDDEDDAA